MGSSLTATLPLSVMVCPTKLCWVGLHSASSKPVKNLYQKANFRPDSQEGSGHLPDYLIDLSVYSWSAEDYMMATAPAAWARSVQDEANKAYDPHKQYCPFTPTTKLTTIFTSEIRLQSYFNQENLQWVPGHHRLSWEKVATRFWVD